MRMSAIRAIGVTAGWLPRLLLVAAVLLAPLPAAADVAIPPLKSRVTDLTGTLDAGQQSAIEKTLAALEAQKGAQVAVLIVPTTQPETVDQYAVRVEEAWKLGRKGVDDSVLLLIAKDDRKLRIEVGYGLEGVLPDAVAKRIIVDDIAPRFKQGDFFGGISAGVDRIARLIGGETLPPPKAQAQGHSDEWDAGTLFMVGLFAVVFLGGILRAIFGRAIGAGIVATVIGVALWFITGLLIVAAIAAIIAFLFALAGGSSGGWGGSSGGGWSSGGGGGFDSGGFSGGGGSSGGGGASGDW
jgi:uncharacterized protein